MISADDLLFGGLKMFVRPVFAWGVAVVIASLVSISALGVYGGPMAFSMPSDPVLLLPQLLGIVAFVSALGGAIAAIPSLVMILAIRVLQAPRPFADVFAVALACALASLFLFSLGGAQAPEVLLLPAPGIVPGALTYWFLAGQPQPPYARR